MIGLIDGNNFYCSCERVFDARLRGKPVVVLSSNDACAIARSNEAKALGVRMGQPIHEVPKDVRAQLHVRSANFQLYGDLSGRIANLLRELFPRLETYSIDENFIELPEGADPVDAGELARQRILQWAGIPCSVGFSTTKTLAKAANKLAKTSASGVVVVTDPISQLDGFPVGDVWGVGPRFAKRLGEQGITTAIDLIEADPAMLRDRYGVILARTQQELQGTPCLDLQEEEPDRQQIVVSRSFGSEITSVDEVTQAVATFAQRACEKLRSRSLSAAGVWVWINTNPFREGAAQYHPSKAMHFPVPTSDTREVLAGVSTLVRSMWKPGYRYKKAGVGLLDLGQRHLDQVDLFTSPSPRAAALMAVLDKANHRFGRDTLGFAAAAARPGSAARWATKREYLSPAYTARWDQLLKVR